MTFPATFYIPAVSALLHPEIVEALRQRPQREGRRSTARFTSGRRGSAIRAEEERLLRRALDFCDTGRSANGPSATAAPYFELSEHTIDLLREAGFAYDSSAMSRDERLRAPG